ncbi:MucB/RseB C-terminal domain-containing protein [Aeromonas schubertii]|uniref:MucB/RseB C-terminal domain-containing protein n=1 Tax=Aeromonas schubertii TaxID=652 RepID=A0ABS7VCZ8_9GAMM|nr:MucB/RseB C-terminal domain-containing protein [Aeromonas schubertii]MBZ6067005.1 MucB/RseB C-terminal domain-containing protein [Aeromonas schubertii]
MRKSRLAVSAALFLICSQASADPASAEALLQQMQSASHHRHFELSMVKVRQGRIESLRYSHTIIKGQQVAHLTHLDGQNIEFLQRADDYTFFEAGHSPYTLKGARFPGIWSALQRVPLDQLTRSYDVVMAGRSRVAGQVSQVVRLVPRDGEKYGFVLWLDEESHLLLRVDMIDREGNLVEQVLGVDLDLLTAAPAWLAKLAAESQPPALALEEAYQAPQQELAWRITWLPDGFILKSRDRHRLVATNQPVDYMMASDGLVDLSVYVSRADPQQSVRQQLIRQGATTLVSFVNDVGVEITVVGEVPAETAKRIAESIKPLSRNEAVQ